MDPTIMWGSQLFCAECGKRHSICSYCRPKLIKSGLVEELTNKLVSCPSEAVRVAVALLGNDNNIYFMKGEEARLSFLHIVKLNVVGDCEFSRVKKEEETEGVHHG